MAHHSFALDTSKRIVACEKNKYISQLDHALTVWYQNSDISCTSSSTPLRCIGRLRRHGSPLRKAPAAPTAFPRRLRITGAFGAYNLLSAFGAFGTYGSPRARRLRRLLLSAFGAFGTYGAPCTRRLRRLQFVKRLRRLRHLQSPL